MDDGLREEISLIKGKQEVVIQQLGNIERKLDLVNPREIYWNFSMDGMKVRGELIHFMK